MIIMHRALRSLFIFLLTAISLQVYAGSKPTFQYDTLLYNKMKWREIGPFRGGRSVAVTGVPSQPYTFYFGATGGGIWKTEDGGSTWINISDGYLKVGIVGALAVAESDPNIIYAGTGEACIRGNAMPGEGIYKSDDAGKTWKFIGLKEAQTVSKIRVHPKDENLVYVAALGHAFGTNPERGVYRSRDGGKSWEKILYKNDSTGAVDILLDPNNARVIYAAMWQASRNPWSMTSGGKGSGLWKSTDGGDTWKDITQTEGLPKGIVGKIGIAISPVKRDRIWVSVEADEGGLFRSDDAGSTWTKMTDDRRIRQRAWYYSHIYADPKSENEIYILNVGFMRSLDGGKTLSGIRVPHGDNHDLWINPNNPDCMIEGNDGGATVTYTGGRTWTDEDIATGQFYHVVLDHQFPYNIYGAQQDNSTVKIPSRTTGFGIDNTDWYYVGGGESGYISPHPTDPDITYAGSYDGFMTKYNHTTTQLQDISPWPDNPMGSGAVATKYRFQWTYPIVVSRFEPNAVYATANVVFKSTDEGDSWNVISPDLTRNDSSKLGSSGGPITKDNTSVEYYCTIFAFAESPLNKRILWTGSDDGLIHVTQDGGATWQNVTPKDLPEWSMVSILDASSFEEGTAYVACNRYKLDDFAPYIYMTTDFGNSWKKIVKGIPANEFTHVVREDPNKKGLLYAGTERGIYVSFNDGENWQPLQRNLPVVPIHDLAIQSREKDLVAATHGRGFWVLDDLTPLYQINDSVAESRAFLYKPRETYRISGFSSEQPGLALGKNPPNGVVVSYYLSDTLGEKDTLKLDFSDEQGKLIKSFSTKPTGKDADDQPKVSADSGMNRFIWDMRYPDAEKVPGAIFWGGTTDGPQAVPGTYQVRMTLKDKSWTQSFEIRKDPRILTTNGQFKEQFDFLLKIRDKISEAHKAVNTIRDIRAQVNDLVKRLEKHPKKDTITTLSKRLNDSLKVVEEAIIQVKIKAGQDALNYPIKLNNKIAALADVVSSADTKPTQQSYEVYKQLSGQLDTFLARYKQTIDTSLKTFNNAVHDMQIPAVILKGDGE